MIKPRQAFTRGVVVAFVIVATELCCLAAESGHGGHAEESSSGAWLSLGFSTINFLAFLFLIHRYAWPALREFLASRHKEVADAMAAAEEARREADAIRAEYAAKEAALEETRRRMLEDIRQGAAADREKSLQEAKAAADRLRADAERQADYDLARARRELRAEAAKLAAEIAEKDVQARLTDADRARLVKEFVEGVARQCHPDP
jgi:F-type H+-transporting ATPase subunit b